MARKRRDYSAVERRELWERWKRGEAVSEIARALDRAPGTIHSTLRERGGIPPRSRRRSRLALTVAEREEISRGIAAERAEHSVKAMCRVLGVSRSGFYAWQARPPSQRALTDAWLSERIRAIHVANRGVYGAPRVHAELALAHQVRVGRKRVERLMAQAHLSGLVVRKRGRTTVRVPGVRVADDLVDRDFAPAAPNVLWVADITYLRTWEGWLYLAAVQDAFSRRIVGWALADHMRAHLVVDALQMAIARRRPDPGLVHHSDQGSSSR